MFMKDVYFSSCIHTNMTDVPPESIWFIPPVVFAGDSVTMYCHVGMDKVFWTLNGTVLTAQNNKLTISPLSSSDAGEKYCSHH